MVREPLANWRSYRDGRLTLKLDDPEDVAQHDRMVEMVEEMLRLRKEHAKAEALKKDRRHVLARQIEQLDAQIDCAGV